MRLALENSHLNVNVAEATNDTVALELILRGDIDLVVSAVSVPSVDAIRLLRVIRRRRDKTTLPVVLVDHEGCDSARETSYVQGVNDYVMGPFSSVELVARVETQLRLMFLQQELRRSDERFRRLGVHDELTGLANRKHMLEASRRELARSRRHRLSMTLCAMEIRHFRELSLRVGRFVSDVIITEMGEVLGATLRTADLLGCLARARFVALLPQTDEAQGRSVAARLAAAVAAHSFSNYDAGDVVLAMGLATYPSGRLESVAELLDTAQAGLEADVLGGGALVNNDSAEGASYSDPADAPER